MKLVKEVAFLHRLYWGVDTSFQTAEDYSDQLQYLLSDTSREEQAEEIKNFFQEVYGEFEKVLGILEEAQRTIEDRLKAKTITPDELWSNHNFRFTETLPGFNSEEVKQMLQTLDEAPELLDLFDQVERLRQNIVLCDNEINELVLTAWRREHPYFSSMGVLDKAIDILSGREVQSDTLKDLKTLDRR